MALIALVLLTGCVKTTANRDPIITPSTDASGRPVGSAGANSPAQALDLALAQSAVVTTNDLPGFSPKAPDISSPSPLDEASGQQLAACLKVPFSDFDKGSGGQEAEAGFENGASEIGSNVAIEPTRAPVDKGWAVFTTPGFAKCLESVARVSFATLSSGGISSVSVTRFEPHVGDRSFGFQIRFTMTAGGTSVDGVMDMIGIFHDRAEISLLTVGRGMEFDRATALRLAHPMLDRVGTKAA